MFGLSKDQMCALYKAKCPSCGTSFVWRIPRYYKSDGSLYSKLIIWPLMEKSTIGECPKCNSRWAVFDDAPLPQKQPSIIFNLIETDRFEEFLGDEKRQIDNSKSSVGLTRRFTVSREWARSYKIEHETTRGSREEFKLGGTELPAITLAAENSLMERYSISNQLKQSYSEEISIEVPARTQLGIVFHWKKIWQRGLIQGLCADKIVVEFPFQVVVGVTFDQSQYVDETTL